MFSYNEYKNIINLIKSHLPIMDFSEVTEKTEKFCVLRHDIEFSIDRAYELAKVEKELGDKNNYHNYNILKSSKIFKGNKPSNTFLFNKLTPYNLGRLIAIYEHKIFVQGCIWNINSFDQWGVELGKILSDKVYDKLSKKDRSQIDNSSRGQLDFIEKFRQ